MWEMSFANKITKNYNLNGTKNKKKIVYPGRLNDILCIYDFTIIFWALRTYVYFIHMILFRLSIHIRIYTYIHIITYKTLLSLNRLLTHLRCGLWPSLYTSNTTHLHPIAHHTQTSENSPYQMPSTFIAATFCYVV